LKKVKKVNEIKRKWWGDGKNRKLDEYIRRLKVNI
jgi:hypothetical protein